MPLLSCPLLILILLLTPVSAAAAPAADTPPAALLVGVESSGYAPFYYVQNGVYQGMARELLDAFAREQALTLDYLPLPVPRLFLRFTRSELDFKFPDHPHWSAAQKSGLTVYYSDPVFHISEALLTRPGHADTIRTVGTIRGFTTPGIEAALQRGELELIGVADIDALLLMLTSGRVDAIYFNTRAARHAAARQIPALALETVPQYPPYHYAYHLSSLIHPDLISRFNDFLQRHQPLLHSLQSAAGTDPAGH